MTQKPMGTFETVALTALRVASSFMLMTHGAQKLFGWLGGMGGNGATAQFPALPWFAGYPEQTGRTIPVVRVTPRAR